MFRKMTAAVMLSMSICGITWAQDKVAPQPAASASAAALVAPSGGIQSANIFEIRPDASADPDYAKQTNGERAKVQPGNNAPMWRRMGGCEG